MLCKCFGKSRLNSSSQPLVLFFGDVRPRNYFVCLFCVLFFTHLNHQSLLMEVLTWIVYHPSCYKTLNSSTYFLSIPSKVSHHTTLPRACCSLQNHSWPYWNRFSVPCLLYFLTMWILMPLLRSEWQHFPLTTVHLLFTTCS